MRKNRYITILCLLTWIFASQATVKLPSIFSDGIVLQQNSKVAIWGKATPKSTVTVQTTWNNSTYTAKVTSDSTWRVNVVTLGAGGPYAISISDGNPVKINNVLLGEVWLASGQSNMEMPLKGFKDQPVKDSEHYISQSKNDQIRFFDVENVSWKRPLDNCNGQWKSANPTNAVNFSAVAYLFAQNLYNQLNVPVAIIESDWGGTPVEAWMNGETLDGYAAVKVPKESNTSNTDKKTPAGLYNAMIHPLVGYGIKGVIWYQGEQNRDNPALYLKLFPAMVKQWRSEWGIGDFPFYYAQIAPYIFKKTTNLPDNIKELMPKVPVLRETQLLSEKKIKNSGMAVLLDVGEEKTIHPSDKKSVADRLFYFAKAKTYNFKDTKYASPVYSKMKTDKNKIILSFENVEEGLMFKDGISQNFEIAGADQVFYPAKARIMSGNEIAVWADNVTKPVAVRYAFKAWVVGDLFNSAGFPASSFRTDKWKIPSKQ
ncbi:MAG: sialate O-acetylesterase [Paludibacteraceae bacterium]